MWCLSFWNVQTVEDVNVWERMRDSFRGLKCFWVPKNLPKGQSSEAAPGSVTFTVTSQHVGLFYWYEIGSLKIPARTTQGSQMRRFFMSSALKIAKILEKEDLFWMSTNLPSRCVCMSRGMILASWVLCISFSHWCREQVKLGSGSLPIVGWIRRVQAPSVTPCWSSVILWEDWSFSHPLFLCIHPRPW